MYEGKVSQPQVLRVVRPFSVYGFGRSEAYTFGNEEAFSMELILDKTLHFLQHCAGKRE